MLMAPLLGLGQEWCQGLCWQLCSWEVARGAGKTDDQAAVLGLQTKWV